MRVIKMCKDKEFNMASSEDVTQKQSDENNRKALPAHISC